MHTSRARVGGCKTKGVMVSAYPCARARHSAREGMSTAEGYRSLVKVPVRANPPYKRASMGWGRWVEVAHALNSPHGCACVPEEKDGGLNTRGTLRCRLGGPCQRHRLMGSCAPPSSAGQPCGCALCSRTASNYRVHFCHMLAPAECSRGIDATGDLASAPDDVVGLDMRRRGGRRPCSVAQAVEGGSRAIHNQEKISKTPQWSDRKGTGGRAACRRGLDGSCPQVSLLCRPPGTCLFTGHAIKGRTRC